MAAGSSAIGFNFMQWRQGGITDGGGDHAVEQAGKAAFEVVAAQRGEFAGADRLGPGDTGLAQLGEMIAEVGLRGQAEEHRAVHRRLAPRQFAHDRKPRRVAECHEHIGQRDLVDAGIGQLVHAPELSIVGPFFKRTLSFGRIPV